MKRLLFHFILLVSTSSLQAEDELFSFGAKLHFSNTIDYFSSKNDAEENQYIRYLKPKLSAEASILSKFSDHFSFETSLTNSQKDSCSEFGFIKTTSITLGYKVLSLDVGCLELEQGGWISRTESHMSPFNRNLNHSFWNGKHAKAININLNFVGTIKFQLIEDYLKDAQKGKLGQVGTNFSWIIDLFGAKPIFQIGFYNAFRAFHYSLGIQAALGNLELITNMTRDHFIHSEAAKSRIIEEELFLASYHIDRLINPYFRYHTKIKITEKAKDKDSEDILAENTGTHLNEANWKQNGTTLSFGNIFFVTEKINVYLNLNLMLGKFTHDKKNKSKWDIRLGLKGHF